MTPIFQPVPSLMLVGLAAETADECARAFPGLLVLKVGHSAAAVERMTVTRPLVVVVGHEVPGPDADLVAQCAQDIQAQVLRESSVPPADLPATVQASLRVAEQNRDRSAPRSTRRPTPR
jgi:hypothetical protein